MIKLLWVIVLGLLLSFNANADDIRDFQIEGISLGDSALDYFTERNVVENLKSYYKDSTIFFITHRLATVSNADVIVMMEDGAIIEQGNHVSLIKKKGAYFSRFNQQESAEIK